jgi:hypothetical protein
VPTIAKRISQAIGTTTDNALANSQYEFAPFDGTIEVGIMASAPLLQVAIFSGPDVLAEPGSPLPFPAGATAAAPIEALPKYPDDYHWEDEVAHGDRLKITISNTNVANGPHIANVILRLTPA